MSKNEKMPDYVSQENFSLESILAEYKGSAFINGDKKTPKDVLHERTEKIIKEAAGPDVLKPFPSADTTRGMVEAYYEAAGSDISDPYLSTDTTRGMVEAYYEAAGPELSNTYPPTGAARSVAGAYKDAPETKRKQEPQNVKEKDSVDLFFENYQSPVSEKPSRNARDIQDVQDTQDTLDTQDSIVEDVEKALQREFGVDEPSKKAGIIDSGAFKHSNFDVFNNDNNDAYNDNVYNEDGILEDQIFEEPDLKETVKKFGEAFSSISLRCIPAVIITFIMVILTFAFEADMIIPFGIGRSHVLATGTLLLALLVVMILCVELVVRGAEFLIRGAPNAETLLLFSCLFSIISAGYSMLKGTASALPYCAISAFSLTCAAIGERYNLRAITETIKTATGSTEPYGVLAEYNHELDKSVLKKTFNRIDGFYNNLMHPDVVESTYRYAAPILLAFSLVLSIFSTLVKGHGEYFLHIVSALFAAAAPFSALLSFSVPFSAVARTIRRSGAAIAGWGGADDICFTDGACVTDDDLFPPGTLKLNGLKLYEGVSPEKAVRYTASLIMASGSGLSHVFSELLKSQGMHVVKVEDFACYEGGISALIRGERVAIGSVGFMNLLGFRIPDDMNMKNAVYTAVNDKLIAVFAVDYSPINSVQGALISILKWRIKLFFAVRDFNVTPSMLEQKFRVSLDDFAYVQAKDSYSISDSLTDKEGRVSAVLTREGFGPFADAVTGGRLLKSAAFIATVASIVSAFLGVIIMFYMCWSGAFVSARPGNLLLFMLSMLAAVLIICGYVRCRK